MDQLAIPCDVASTLWQLFLPFWVGLGHASMGDESSSVGKDSLAANSKILGK